MKIPGQMRFCFLLLVLLVAGMGCDPVIRDQGPESNGQDQDTYDIDALGIPRFVTVQYITLTKIWRISRFRSGIGHDYSDDFEDCRSMKHYFQPRTGIDWSRIQITAPVDGTVQDLTEEWAGTRITIQSQQYPAFYFTIFHINLREGLLVGDQVQAGENLGFHIGSQTWSDVAVRVDTPGGSKLVSYFSTMTDQLFQKYRALGQVSPNRFIISREARDNDPLNCSGDEFENQGNINNWVILN
jgi:hypothetical protein